MSQIILSNYFTLQKTNDDQRQAVADLSIAIPQGKLFSQLPDHRLAANVQSLGHRVERLQALESRLIDAKIHQNRDRIIVCIAGAIMVGLVAGIVLGAHFCLPLALVSAFTLFVLGGASIFFALNHACEDGRIGPILFAGTDGAGYMPIVFPFGIPVLMYHFLTRKNALQNEVDSLQTGVKSDLLAAGQYLQQHSPAIREKLNKDIASFEVAIEQIANLQLPIQTNIDNLRKALDESRAVLAELNERGQPMVDRMVQSGLLAHAQ